jgi:hypothetical protein
MRLLVVIPHYFGPVDSANSSSRSASYLDPLSRIAALNETIISLHRNFGPYRSRVGGIELPSANTIDIVIVAMRERTILPELGIDPDIYTVEYVEGPPTRIPFHAHRLMEERLGRYDFYCLLEHDIAIHDPAFFDKLAWFQHNFGPRALLAPTRVETAATGIPGKVIVDPLLRAEETARFRRPGQRYALQALWHGREIRFELPSNPHAAGYFLSPDQLAYWVAQPSFDDGDASWFGPIESAMTLGVGKVFDIYKAVAPDPFFLEVHHYGATFAAIHPPHGRRYGEPPLLAIAQGAIREAMRNGKGADAEVAGHCKLSHQIRAWLADGTIGERVGQAMAMEWETHRLEAHMRELEKHAQNRADHSGHLAGEIAELRVQMAELSAEAHEKAAEIDARIPHSDELQTSATR